MHTTMTNHPTGRLRRRLAATAVAGALAATTLLAGTSAAADDQPGADPSDLVYTGELDGAKLHGVEIGRLGKDAHGRLGERDLELAKKDKSGQDVPKPRDPGRISPDLAKLLDTSDHDKPVEVLVTLRDDVAVPRFPQPSTDQSRESDTNRRALDQASELVAQLTKTRAPAYDKLADQFRELDGTIGQTFWLINAATVELPLGNVKQLLERDDLVYVQLDETVTRPPVDGDPTNDIRDGRQRIASDPYFNLGQTGGWIGLLDSGVRADHTSLTGPDRIALHMDLTGDGDPGDNCDWWSGHGHGTASASILTGNANLGFDWRGVSGVRVDSFDVYGDDCGLNASAAVDGFQLGVAVLDRVIVAEIQADEAETGAIATAADAAYDAGVAVIAANGNFGPNASTVRSPGNAHKALGIGADHVTTSSLKGYSGRGPTNDDRIKPDLVAPTDTEAASTAGTTATWEFGGTSGATPYAGGAASLVRNWMAPNGSFDPGHVYARMLLYGQNAYPFDNNTGAGDLVMGTGGSVHYGKVNVTDGATIDIPVTVASGRNTIQVALWWPESPGSHDDVDVVLRRPDGGYGDGSFSIPSVFERAAVNGSATPGTWTVRISGYDVTGTQPVYWSARTR